MISVLSVRKLGLFYNVFIEKIKIDTSSTALFRRYHSQNAKHFAFNQEFLHI